MDKIREKLVELLEQNEIEFMTYSTDKVIAAAIGDDPVDRFLSRAVFTADYLLANDVTVQEWIPVSERLPHEDGSYLVTTNYFGKHQGINIRWFAKDGETVNKYDLAGQKYVWYFYDSEYGYVSTDSVTHWMQLPQPPKGEENG